MRKIIFYGLLLILKMNNCSLTQKPAQTTTININKNEYTTGNGDSQDMFFEYLHSKDL